MTEVETSGIQDIAVSKYFTKKAFDKSSSFINLFESTSELENFQNLILSMLQKGICTSLQRTGQGMNWLT